jgi:hypothetical protein
MPIAIRNPNPKRNPNAKRNPKRNPHLDVLTSAPNVDFNRLDRFLDLSSLSLQTLAMIRPLLVAESRAVTREIRSNGNQGSIYFMRRTDFHLTCCIAATDRLTLPYFLCYGQGPA